MIAKEILKKNVKENVKENVKLDEQLTVKKRKTLYYFLMKKIKLKKIKFN